MNVFRISTIDSDNLNEFFFRTQMPFDLIVCYGSLDSITIQFRILYCYLRIKFYFYLDQTTHESDHHYHHCISLVDLRSETVWISLTKFKFIWGNYKHISFVLRTFIANKEQINNRLKWKKKSHTHSYYVNNSGKYFVRISSYIIF